MEAIYPHEPLISQVCARLNRLLFTATVSHLRHPPTEGFESNCANEAPISNATISFNDIATRPIRHLPRRKVLLLSSISMYDTQLTSRTTGPQSMGPWCLHSLLPTWWTDSAIATTLIILLVLATFWTTICRYEYPGRYIPKKNMSRRRIHTVVTAGGDSTQA